MILIDTHVVVWTTQEPSQLSAHASQALVEARQEGGVAIADITFRELAFLTVRKRISIDTPLDRYLRFVGSIFHVLPIDGRIAERSLSFGKATLMIRPIRSLGQQPSFTAYSL